MAEAANHIDHSVHHDADHPFAVPDVISSTSDVHLDAIPSMEGVSFVATHHTLITCVSLGLLSVSPKARQEMIHIFQRPHTQSGSNARTREDQRVEDYYRGLEMYTSPSDLVYHLIDRTQMDADIEVLQCETKAIPLMRIAGKKPLLLLNFGDDSSTFNYENIVTGSGRAYRLVAVLRSDSPKEYHIVLNKDGKWTEFPGTRSLESNEDVSKLPGDVVAAFYCKDIDTNQFAREWQSYFAQEESQRDVMANTLTNVEKALKVLSYLLQAATVVLAVCVAAGWSGTTLAIVAACFGSGSLSLLRLSQFAHRQVLYYKEAKKVSGRLKVAVDNGVFSRQEIARIIRRHKDSQEGDRCESAGHCTTILGEFKGEMSRAALSSVISQSFFTLMMLAAILMNLGHSAGIVFAMITVFSAVISVAFHAATQNYHSKATERLVRLRDTVINERIRQELELLHAKEGEFNADT